MPPKFETVMDTLSSFRGQYSAGVENRFRRNRSQLGGSADTHLTPFQLWRVREYVRDMDRNDPVVGQLVDRACDNIVGEGFILQVSTGDKGLDQTLEDIFNAWAHDAAKCDSRRQHNLDAMGWLAKRHEFVDGDIFGLPLSAGPLQMMEAHRCGANQATLSDVVHGIKIDSMDRPQEYRFSKLDSHVYHTQYSAEFEPVAAYDSEGNPNVFHVFSATRFSQTRGVPAFMAVFDHLSMLDDVNFAKLVQQQVVSCIGLFIERDKDFKFKIDAKLGSRDESLLDDDSTTRQLEKLRPGLVVKGRPGEKATSMLSNVPNAEYFDHVRLILRIIGAQLGMPLTLTLLDTHDTTFHGYRGELNEARKGFRRRQNNLADKFYSPVYRWRTRVMLKEILRAAPSAHKLLQTGAIWKHKWMRPTWQYIDPSKDAQSDVVQLNNLLESPRSLHASRGRDFGDIVIETVEDNGSMIEAAIVEAERINKLLVSANMPTITWREILQPLVSQQSIQISANEGDAGGGETKPADKPAGKPAKKPQQVPAKGAA